MEKPSVKKHKINKLNQFMEKRKQKEVFTNCQKKSKNKKVLTHSLILREKLTNFLNQNDKVSI